MPGAVPGGVKGESMLFNNFKLAVLKKIDPAIFNTSSTRTTKDYLNSMVSATNRGLQDLATTGKYIIKEFKISQHKIHNLLPDQCLNIMTHYKENIEYSAPATSYHFEVNNAADIVFTIDDVEVHRIEHRPMLKGEFVKYKGFIPNEDLKLVKVCFCGQFAYDIWNVALYDQPFESENDIWDFVSEKRYNLRDLAPNFYKLAETDIVYQEGYSGVRYQKTDAYYWEGDSTLVLDGLRGGSWIVHYYAYPIFLKEDVADDFAIELDPEVLQLLIIFVASELIYDDDRSTSGAWRNHYESGKELLQPTAAHSKSEFVDVQGW